MWIGNLSKDRLGVIEYLSNAQFVVSLIRRCKVHIPHCP
jgi:hypothetical protein